MVVLLLLTVSVALLAGAVKKWKTWQEEIVNPSLLVEEKESPETLSMVSMSVAGKSVSTKSPVSRLTEAQYQSLYAAEGGPKAYNYIGTKRLQAQNPGSICYSVSQLSGDYLTAAKNAFVKMTAVSSRINVSYKPYYSPSDKFVAATNYVSDGNFAELNAWNLFDANGAGKIYASRITFNTYQMDAYTLSVKKMLAMHELGHTFGLTDFYPSSSAYAYDATIMKAYYVSGMTVFTDYQRFDKESLRAIYGN